MVGERPTHRAFPSDALHSLLKFRDEFPALRQFLDIIQIVIVLDASAVQSELRWRLGSRTNPTARSGLHEAIDSGAVIAVAPVFLRLEIAKYLLTIATETGVTVEAVSIEWERVQQLIKFYAPIGDRAEFATVDPEDADYALTAKELDADFVRTNDSDFAQMGVAVIGPEHDGILREYARSTTIFVSAKLGSAFALTISIEMFAQIIQTIAEVFRRLPPIVKFLMVAAAIAVLLHPTSREKVIQGFKRLWQRVQQMKPALVSFSEGPIKRLAEAAQTSTRTGKLIQAKLRSRGKQTALACIRLICVKAGEPLSAGEIARRVLVSGYCSRSKNFVAYVRRLLREDGRFAANANGLWMLRAAA